MKISLVILSAVILNVKSARILAVFPTPSISHQIVFRPLLHELVNRGHEVILITADPAFPSGRGPANLTEINMHDIAYKPWDEYMPKQFHASLDPAADYDVKAVTTMLTFVFTNIMTEQLASQPVQKLIKDKTLKFDLLLLEAYQRTALVFSHFFKAPVIQMSSFGSAHYNMETFGAVTHPILHPNGFTRKVINFSLYEKAREYYNFLIRQYIAYSFQSVENEMIRKAVGPGVPPLNELANNVDMIFLNVHPIWEFNRPVPPNVIFLGALHMKPEKELPKDLKSYLDSSKTGVIYMSFGTNVQPSMFPPGSIDTFLKVFAGLPYNILWKWYTEDVPGLPKNVKISKWFPQRDLLMHQNIKLFITQGGLQSTDETILAGVPVIGIPMIGDQWYNVDLCVDRGIGVRLDVSDINEDNFRKAIENVINNKSYRENVIKLRSIIYDQPETALERAVWWTEYVLRHKGARHLRAAGANMSFVEYYDFELVAYVLAFLVFVFIVSVLVIYYLVKCVLMFTSKKKLKRN